MRRARPLVLLLLAAPACAQVSSWFQKEPEWARKSGIQHSGDKVLAVGRADEVVGSAEAVRAAEKDGRRRLSEAILTRVESETLQRYKFEAGSRVEGRVSKLIESQTRTSSAESLPGVEVEDSFVRRLREDDEGRSVLEAAVLVSMPRDRFQEMVRLEGEKIEAELLRDPDLVFGLAEVAFQDGDDARARKLVEGILRRSPGDVGALLFRAQILERQGDLQEARSQYRIVRELDPKGGAGLTARACLARLESEGKPREPAAAAKAPEEAPPPPKASGAQPPPGSARAPGPKEIRPRKLGSHSKAVHSIAIRRDGKVLASGSRADDGKVKVFDIDDGRLLQEKPGVAPVAFSHAGAVLAFGGLDCGIQFLDLEAGDLRQSEGRHAGWVSGLAFSTDDATVFSAGLDNTIRRWSVSDGKLIETYNEPDLVNAIAFNPLKDLLVSACFDRKVRCFQTSPAQLELRETFPVPHDPKSVAVSPDGAFLAAGSWDFVYIFGLDEGSARTIPCRSGWAWSVLFSPDSLVLAVGGSGGEIRLFRAGNGRPLLSLPAHQGAVNCLAFRRDGKLLASGGDDGAVNAIDLPPLRND